MASESIHSSYLKINLPPLPKKVDLSVPSDSMRISLRKIEYLTLLKKDSTNPETRRSLPKNIKELPTLTPFHKKKVEDDESFFSPKYKVRSLSTKNIDEIKKFVKEYSGSPPLLKKDEISMVKSQYEGMISEMKEKIFRMRELFHKIQKENHRLKEKIEDNVTFFLKKEKIQEEKIDTLEKKCLEMSTVNEDLNEKIKNLTNKLGILQKNFVIQVNDRLEDSKGQIQKLMQENDFWEERYHTSILSNNVRMIKETKSKV